MTWIIKKIIQKETIPLYENCLFTPISCNYLSAEIEYCLLNNIEGVFNLSGDFILSKFDFGVLINNLYNGKNKNLVKSCYFFNGIGPRRAINQAMLCKKYIDKTGRNVQSINDFTIDLGKYIKNFKL